MNYLKLVILVLILLNFPSYALININVLTGTILSYVTFILILVYYFFNKKEKLIVPFIVLGLLYFLISLLVDSQNSENFIIIFIKYYILIIGAKLIVDSKDIEINIILLIGALSIVYESIFIIDIGGRYSGFYLNPNSAGFACLIGFCFSMFNKDKKIKALGQILFSFAGFLTFSRTFLLLWVLINIISISISYKNSYKILAGVLLFSVFISLGNKFDYQVKRYEAFSSILDGVYSDEFEEDSRLETWEAYYDRIYASPLFGNGFKSFSGKTYGTGENSYSIQGVHNAFLMILGEAGFFVFIFFTLIYCGFIARGIKLFKEDPLIFFVSFSLFLYMLTNHNFFDNYFILFLSLWLYIQIDRHKLKVNKSQ
jgi:hypothetical protein